MLRFFTTERMLFLVTFAVLGTATVVYDPDYYFHLAAGDYFLRHHGLPDGDVFSFTMAGQPWHIHEWLFEVLVAGLNRAAGGDAVIWLIESMGVGAFYLAYLAGRGQRQRGLATLLPVLLLMVFYLLFVTQRPQVITYLCYALYLYVLLEVKYENATGKLWLLPLLMIVWVNSHGGYLLGIAILAAFLAAEAWTVWRQHGRVTMLRKYRLLGVVFVLVLLASLLNPYLYGSWWFPLSLMNSDAMHFITEWQPPQIDDPLFLGYALCVLLYLAHMLSLGKKGDAVEWLLPGCVIVASLGSFRHLPLAILTLLPFLLRTLPRSPLAGSFSFASSSRAHSTELGGREYGLNLAVISLVLVLLGIFSPRIKHIQQRMLERMLPVQAVDFMQQHALGGRVFNQYRYGGYLLYRLYPAIRVFVDSRADMYGSKLLQEYGTIISAADGWQSLFDAYQVDLVVCQKEAPLVDALLLRGDFELRYQDEYSVVLARRQPR